MTATLSMLHAKLMLECNDMQTELARQIPGMRFNSTINLWTAPISPLAVDIAWSAFRGTLDVTDEVVSYRRRWNITYRQLDAMKRGVYRPSFVAKFPDISEDLWPLQNDGVGFLVTAKTAYLCDDMGAGKTIQCARALDYIGEPAFPVLVVANKSALDSVWRQEITNWSKETDHVAVVEGTATQRKKALAVAQECIADGLKVVVIIGWSNLTGHSRLAPYGGVSLSDKEKTPKELNEFEFKTVIIDELHKAKDWTTKWTRALWQVAHSPSVQYRWGLTGTIVTGKEEDVWSMGHTIQPDFYPRKTTWTNRYVDIRRLPGRDWPIIIGFRPERLDELLKHFDPFMLRRTKEEIIPDYQGKLPLRTVTVKMTGKQKKAYDQMSDHMLAEGEGGLIAAPAPITQLLRQNQFAAATPVIEEVTDPATGESRMKVVALTKPSCKGAALLELLEEMGDAQAVVFAESRLLIDFIEELLAKEGITTARVTGNETGAIRTANQAVFQAGNVRVMLCTYGAGAESITLNHADVVIRLQRTYNFVLDTQAPDRVDRGERKVPVQVIDIVTENSTEGKVHKRVGEKDDVFQEIVRDALRGGK